MARQHFDGYPLPLLLLGGFRTLIDDLHAQLAAEGFPEMRPTFGFAMQAIGSHGATSTEIAQRTGVSKQAAGKTVDALEAHGLAVRVADAGDRRQKRVELTPRGVRCLERSGEILSALVGGWAAELGEDRVAQMIEDLQRVVGTPQLLDVSGWIADSQPSALYIDH